MPSCCFMCTASLPPATKLGQGYVFTGMCDSVHRGGCLPQCMLGYHTPRSRHPPEADTPWRQTPPRADTPQKQNPPGADTPQKQNPPGGRHPLEQTPQGADTILGAPPSEQTHTPLPEQTPPGADTTPLEADTHPLEQTPPEQTPPRADTPPPQRQSMLGDTVNARAVRILLECNLVQSMSLCSQVAI